MKSNNAERLAIAAFILLIIAGLVPWKSVFPTKSAPNPSRLKTKPFESPRNKTKVPFADTYIVEGDDHAINLDGTYEQAGTLNGKPYAQRTDPVVPEAFIFWSSTRWIITPDLGVESTASLYGPEEDTDAPPSAGWLDYGLSLTLVTVDEGGGDPDPEPEGNTMPNHIFSTGVLTVANNAGGGTLTLAVLQNITLTPQYQERKLYETCHVNVWPVDVAHYDASFSIAAEFVTVSAEVLQILMGNTQAGTNPKVLTAPVTVSLPSMTLVLTTKDTAGGTITFTAYDIRCPGLELNFRRDDYTIPSFGSQIILSDTADVPYKWEMPTPA